MIDSRRIELCLLIIWHPIRYVQMGEGGRIKKTVLYAFLFFNILIIFVWFCFILKEIGLQETENQPKKYRLNPLISMGWSVHPFCVCTGKWFLSYTHSVLPMSNSTDGTLTTLTGETVFPRYSSFWTATLIGLGIWYFLPNSVSPSYSNYTIVIEDIDLEVLYISVWRLFMNRV